MMTKKIVAWSITDPDGEKCAIVFHHHGMAARRLGCNEINVDFDDKYVEFRREPQFDEYASVGKVPLSVRMQNGWWVTCGGCNEKLHDETYMDSDDERPAPIIDDGLDFAFCNEECKAAYLRLVACIRNLHTLQLVAISCNRNISDRYDNA